MARKTLVDLEIERAREWKRYYEKTMYYIERIKSIVRKYDPSAKIILFGSYVRGELRPDSDIDILIVTELAGNINQRLKLRVEIAREIGDSTPFQIHIVTPNEYLDWYSKFINKHITV